MIVVKSNRGKLDSFGNTHTSKVVLYRDWGADPELTTTYSAYLTESMSREYVH